MLTVIIPAFNEEQMISLSREKICEVLDSNKIESELLYIDDGSVDNTWQEIQKASESCNNVRGVHFSRNFGKEAAILAGLNEAKGECAVVIDCDLQHPPEAIVEMYRLWEQGYEIVEGVKLSRGKESKLHKFAAGSFYSLIGLASGLDMESASDFKLMDRRAVDVLKNLNEKNGFFRAMSSWVGFKKTTVHFEVQERIAGESKWSSRALIKYAISNISSFSTAPMQLVTILGIITFIISFIFGCISLVQYFGGTATEGFTTVIILQLLTSSLIMMSIGIVGYYIARIFEEVKNRPLYIVSEKCGDEEDK